MHESKKDEQFKEETAPNAVPQDAPVPEWSTQDLGMAIFVTLGRIYDLMALVAIQADPEGAGEVLALHEEGMLKGAPPSMQYGEEAQD